MAKIRPSGISSFFECSYRWYRDNLSDKPIRRVGAAAHFGTSIHKASETYYNECIKEAKWARYTKDLESLAIDTFREKLKDDEPSDVKEISLPTIEKDLQVFTNIYLSNAQLLNKDKLPIATEKSYTVKVKSPIIEEVSGTLDIVGRDYIIDIKTMNKRKNPKTYILQQAAYAFLREKSNEPVNDLIIHRIVTKNHTEAPDAVSILDFVYTPVDALIENVKDLLVTIVKLCNLYYKTGQEEIFRGNPTSLFCSSKYCAYWKECKYHGA